MLYHIIMPYPFYWDFFGSTGQFLDSPKKKGLYKALSCMDEVLSFFSLYDDLLSTKTKKLKKKELNIIAVCFF